jgi:hypothetical protein
MEERNIHSLHAQRELRRIRHRQSTVGMLGFIALVILLLILVIETGRAFRQMKRVGAFVSTLSTQSPDEVKATLDGFVPLLVDHNPLVRNAAAAAFTAATGMQSDGIAADWKAWWEQHRETWRYGQTPNTNEAMQTVSPQPYRQAFPKQ